MASTSTTSSAMLGQYGHNNPLLPPEEKYGNNFVPQIQNDGGSATVQNFPTMISKPLSYVPAEKDIIVREPLIIVSGPSSSGCPVKKREASDELMILPEMVQCPLSNAFSMAGVANGSALQSSSSGMSGNLQLQPSSPPPLRGCQRLFQVAPLPTGSNQRRPLPIIPANTHDPIISPEQPNNIDDK